jgi:hypothetical protein
MSKLSEEEQLAETWLKSRGYAPDFQSKIVLKGRSPDFLATGPGVMPSIWTEVKKLERETVNDAMDRAFDIIHETELAKDIQGHAALWVNGATRDQSVRGLLKLFIEHAPKYRGQHVRLGFVQQQPDVGGLRRIDLNDCAIPEHFWIRGAGELAAAVPLGMAEESFQTATITERGTTRISKVYEAFEWNANFNCALAATLKPGDLPLTINPMGGGFVSVTSRIVTALESANGQIRNACDYQPVPAVVLLYPPQFGPIDNQQVAAAAYGKLMMPLSIPGGKAGPLTHGPDAVFQSKKNRHISAAIRMNTDGSAGMYFPNFFAHYPISKGSPLLADIECYPPAAE